ncbi:MAG: hypothetical protein ABI846_13115 [Rudaea sp.]
MLQKLIPKIFYAQIADALDLFVAGMDFKILHQDADLVVVERDGAKAYLVQNAEYAAKDRPEIAIETDSLEALFAEIRGRRPDLLHPNLAAIKTQPWGAREFALRDKTDVCVIFRQW